MRAEAIRTIAGGLVATCLTTAAAPVLVPLDPTTTSVVLRVYGLGMLPVDGVFTRFRGNLILDGSDAATCQVELVVEVSSLAMSASSVRDDILSPDLMDAAAYPSLSYRGACQASGSGIGGDLTMHGVTHPLALSLDRDARRLKAVGDIRRADWGVTGKPLMAGPTVRITVTARAPQPN